jgi:hypothetical protein
MPELQIDVYPQDLPDGTKGYFIEGIVEGIFQFGVVSEKIIIIHHDEEKEDETWQRS